jgi:hypothetical protein
LSSEIATAPEIKTESSSPMEIPVATSPDTSIVKTETPISLPKLPGFPFPPQKEVQLKILGVPNKSR